MGLGWMVASINDHNEKIETARFEENMRKMRSELNDVYNNNQGNIPYNDPIYIQNVELVNTMQTLIYEMDALIETMEKCVPVFNININVSDSVQNKNAVVNAVKDGIIEAIKFG